MLIAYLEQQPTSDGAVGSKASAGVGVRDLQDFLGHKSINSTTRYAALASGRFKSIVDKM